MRTLLLVLLAPLACFGQATFLVTQTATNLVYQPRWDDSMVPALAIKTGAAAPTLGAFGPSGGLQCYLFQSGSVNDQCWFTIQVPHGVIEGTPSDLRMHIHWTQTAAPDAPGNTNVVWGLEYSYASIMGTFQAPTTLYVTNGVSGTNWKHQISSFPHVTNETQGISGIINCRMFRYGTATADTYSSDCAFIGADVHIELDSLGSAEEKIK